MPVRPKKRHRKRNPIDIAIRTPDVIAVYGDDDQLVGWDRSVACAYLATHASPCNDDCAARGHIEPW